MIVIIDDERTFLTRGEETIYLRTSQEAFEFFGNYLVDSRAWPIGYEQAIDEIWFDHDLGEKSTSNVIQVAKFIYLLMRSEFALFSKTNLFIHSQNPVGARNIQNVFVNLKKAELVLLPPLL